MCHLQIQNGHDMVLEVGMQTRYPKTLSILIRCIGTHIMVQTSMILGRNMLRCIPGRLVIHIVQSLTALIVKHLLQGSLSLTNLYFALFVGQLCTQSSNVRWQDRNILALPVFSSNNSNNLVVLCLSSLHLCYHEAIMCFMDWKRLGWILGMMSARGAASKRGW